MDAFELIDDALDSDPADTRGEALFSLSHDEITERARAVEIDRAQAVFTPHQMMVLVYPWRFIGGSLCSHRRSGIDLSLTGLMIFSYKDTIESMLRKGAIESPDQYLARYPMDDTSRLREKLKRTSAREGFVSYAGELAGAAHALHLCGEVGFSDLLRKHTSRIDRASFR